LWDEGLNKIPNSVSCLINLKPKLEKEQREKMQIEIKNRDNCFSKSTAIKSAAGVIGLVGLMLSTPMAQSITPIRLHPTNPHVFEFRGKATVLVLSLIHI
jgi:hypothetical protein